MTKRERTIAAIAHKDSDVCPWNIDLTQQARDALVEYTGDPAYPEKMGNHLISAHCGAPQVELTDKPGYWKDYFGVVWNKTGADKDIGVIEGLNLLDADLSCYKFPETPEEEIRKNCEWTLANAGDKCTVAAIGFSMFERAWTLRGMENLLVDMVADEEFVHELLDAICEHNLKIIEVALEYPFDGFYFGDDWGQQKGLIMGPGHWRRFIKPRVARMYDRVRREGKFVIQHSCGDIHEIFGDVIDIGLNVYQTFQPEIYNLREVKATVGQNLGFWGGISTQRDLPFVSPHEVKRIARETIGIMGKGGGYIAAPTHAVPFDVPPQNIVALVEAFQNQMS